jgi:hypothetical protein
MQRPNKFLFKKGLDAVGEVAIFTFKGSLHLSGVKIDRAIPKNNPSFRVYRHNLDTCLADIKTDDWLIFIE